MPTYRASTYAELEGLVLQLQQLECWIGGTGLGPAGVLCRQCDVKALALVAAFLSPRVVEDAGGPPAFLEEEDFEEVPF